MTSVGYITEQIAGLVCSCIEAVLEPCSCGTYDSDDSFASTLGAVDGLYRKGRWQRLSVDSYTAGRI